MAKRNNTSLGISRKCLAIVGTILLFVAINGWYIATELAPGWCATYDNVSMTKAAVSYTPLINEIAARHGVSPNLVKALIWKESRFNEKAVGSHGEVGLMQLMPIAVEEWTNRTRAKAKPTREQLFTPRYNIEIGTWYLAWTGSHWKGYASQEILQLSEYNAGYGNVTKHWKPKNPATVVRLSDISFPSTRQYVGTILKNKAIFDAETRR